MDEVALIATATLVITGTVYGHVQSRFIPPIAMVVAVLLSIGMFYVPADIQGRIYLGMIAAFGATGVSSQAVALRKQGHDS